MTPSTPDDFLGAAFEALGEDLQEPAGRDEVRTVVETARTRIARSRSRRRRMTSGVGVLLLAVGTISGLPQTRQAAAAILDRLGAFLTGSDESPGRPLPPDEPAELLNVLTNGKPGTERIIAQRGALRMLGFRDTLDQACISIGQAFNGCGPPTYWEGLFSGGVVVVLATTPSPNEPIVPLWGLATARVASVEVRYAHSGTQRSAVTGYGFIVPADGRRAPRTLVAIDASGVEVARADLSALRWSVCLDPEGCP